MKQKLKNACGFTPPAPKIKPREGLGHPSLAQLRVFRPWKGGHRSPTCDPHYAHVTADRTSAERPRHTLWRHLWHRKVTDVCQASATSFTFTHLKDRSTIVITSPCLRCTGSATTAPFTWVGQVELKLNSVAYRVEERGNSDEFDDWVKSAMKREKNKTSNTHLPPAHWLQFCSAALTPQGAGFECHIQYPFEGRNWEFEADATFFFLFFFLEIPWMLQNKTASDHMFDPKMKRQKGVISQAMWRPMPLANNFDKYCVSDCFKSLRLWVLENNYNGKY